MTNSFKKEARRFLLPLHFSTGPSKLFKSPEIAKPLPSAGGVRGTGPKKKMKKKTKTVFFYEKSVWFRNTRGSFLGQQAISTHDEQNELETLNDTESDEVAAAKKALTLEIKAHDDNSN
jgi:hypothetical protein